nr:multicopper oxidase domain-containing protein [Chitinophagaceae bacterium]
MKQRSMQKLKQKGIFPVQLFFMLIMLLSFAACKNQSSTSVVDKTFSGDGDGLERVKQEMVAPPNLPKFDQVAKGEPKIVEVTLTAIEKKIEVAPGDSMWAFTFNGSVPGPMIVVHQNDFVELTLKNPATNTQMHNIDFHASTGAMGGGDLTFVNPGEEVKLRFRCTRPGVFVYHCAPGGKMVPIHVTAGMNGAIMVLPREGLKDENGKLVTFDKAYYMAEQDFYLPKDENGKLV